MSLDGVDKEMQQTRMLLEMTGLQCRISAADYHNVTVEGAVVRQVAMGHHSGVPPEIRSEKFKRGGHGQRLHDARRREQTTGIMFDYRHGRTVHRSDIKPYRHGIAP